MDARIYLNDIDAVLELILYTTSKKNQERANDPSKSSVVIVRDHTHLNLPKNDKKITR